jgi:hypothetical protein
VTRVLALLLAATVAASAYLSVPAGTGLHEFADEASRRLTTIDEDVELEALQSKDGWSLVRYRGYKGWVRPGADESKPRGVSDAERTRLSRAWRLLKKPRETRLGPLPLTTDVADGPLLDRLSRVAAALPAAYAKRYGLEADLGRPGDHVVVFEREDDYAAFADDEPSLAGLKTAGNAGRSVAVLVAGRRDDDDVAALLVHELAHLLNARAFAGELPPWLEEGIAEELSYARIAKDGTLEPGTLRARRSKAAGETITPRGRVRWVRYDVAGPEAIASRLGGRARAGDLIPVETLLSMPWRSFADPAARTTTYPESALLVRFLLDNEPTSAAFRGFLAAVAAGAPARASDLAGDLGRDAPSLDRAFKEWLARFTLRSAPQESR